MTWRNGPITVYHGTDNASAVHIEGGSGLAANHAIDLYRCSPTSDFGRGFYTTTNQQQARSWATQCALTTAGVPAVIRFDTDRLALGQLSHLAFVRPTSDFYDPVGFSRRGGLFHGRSDGASYDVVHGPVGLWPQNFIMAGCDQISFHTDAALRVLLVTAVMTFPRF